MPEQSPRARVGIRELRQNLSIYVDRVKAGETLEVTEHGHPVAELGPIELSPRSVYQQMLSDGRLTSPAEPLGLLPPLVSLPIGVASVSRTLEQMRDEERG